MSQLMQKSGANFVTKDLFVALGLVPEVIQEQNNLWWKRFGAAAGKIGPGKQAERVFFYSIGLQSGVWLVFKGDRQLLRFLAEGFGEFLQRGFDFGQGELL